MRKILVIATLMFAAVNASADHSKQVGEPMVATAKSLIADGKLVLDVRQEACDGYVKGAQLISIDDFSSAPEAAIARLLKLTNNDKSTFVAVYCKSGARSGKVISILQANGFSNLHNLGGVGEYYDSTTMQKCE